MEPLKKALNQLLELLQGAENQVDLEAQSTCLKLLELFSEPTKDEVELVKESIRHRRKGNPKKLLPKNVTIDKYDPTTISTTNVVEIASTSQQPNLTQCKKSTRSRTANEDSNFIYGLKNIKRCDRIVYLDKVTTKPKISQKRIADDTLSSTASSKAAKKNRNLKGETDLHAACTAQNVAKVKQLLSEGANPNTIDNAGWTPLHEVVLYNLPELVELLLEKQAIPDVPGPLNETPMHGAVKRKNELIIMMLAKYGANWGLRNSKGISPYNLADDAIKKLLQSSYSTDNHFKMNAVASLLHNANKNTNYYMYPSSLYSDASHKLKLLAKHHPNLKIAKTIDQHVTHVIVNDSNCRTDVDTLTAVLFGVPILSVDWIAHSDELHLAAWRDHEIPDLVPERHGPRLSYINRLKLYPGLFNNCHFYFYDMNSNYEISKELHVNKQILTELVKCGGGVVLKREPNPECIPTTEALVPFHVGIADALANCSHYIIYRKQPKLCYNMKHIKTLPVGWLIECIQKFQLVNP